MDGEDKKKNKIKDDKKNKALEEEEYMERLRRIKRQKIAISTKNKHWINDFYWEIIVAVVGMGLVRNYYLFFRHLRQYMV
jgi:hypothetical protein